MDKRHNKDGFFNLKGYLEIIEYNWKSNLLLAINCERNNGKSTGTWEYIENEIWIKHNYTRKILYCRTTLIQLDKARADFNNMYRGKYHMTTDFIYKIAIDDKGKEILNKRQEIGAIAAISTQLNHKSKRFNNYNLVFWDEYNDMLNLKGIYDEFTNLIKSVQRFTTPFAVLLIGNKDNANNEFMVRWGVEIEEDNKEDTIIEISTIDDKTKIWFIDVSFETFKNLNQVEGVANSLANYSYTMNRYINKSGYRNSQHIDVINYSRRIEPTHNINYYLMNNNIVFEIGDFQHHKIGLSKYVRQLEDGEKMSNKYKTYAVNNISGLNNKNKILDTTDAFEIVEMLFNKSRDNRLYYTSFDGMNMMKQWMSILLKMM